MTEHQLEVCRRFGVEPQPVADADKLGIALDVRDGVLPVHGLRLSPDGGTSGWYIWAGGAMSTEDDYFKPLHAVHLDAWCPAVRKYLALPPGWRFLVAGDYEDVWFDWSLLGG